MPDYPQAGAICRWAPPAIHRAGQPVDLLVIHSSLGWANERGLGRAYARNAAARAPRSVHAAVGRRGKIARYLPLSDGACHTGTTRADLRSIAVALCNRGPVRKRAAERATGTTEWLVAAFKSDRVRWWERYTEQQLRGLGDFLEAVVAEVPSLRYIVGAEDLVSGSQAPGPAFCWETFDFRALGLVRVQRDWATGRWVEHRGSKRLEHENLPGD